MKAFTLPSLLLAVLVASGCASHFTNLTPRSAVPVRTDVYHFEVQWDTSRRGANTPSVKAYVMIDETLFPMNRITGINDRWEADVPVPTAKPVISYRYKFDYTYPTLSQPAAQSDLSTPYFLDLRSGASPATLERK
ncbi:MAG: hypothetical protein U1G08_07315 [Verrucomicrobiota bacterium]